MIKINYKMLKIPIELYLIKMKKSKIFKIISKIYCKKHQKI